MANRNPFAPDEWYHCFSRGVEGRKTFESKEDYERFLGLLYLSNSVDTRHRSDLVSPTLEGLMLLPRGETLVNIGAYCLMPNHFHLLLQEKEEGGITSFMRKLGTGYAMYFNMRHDRIGNLFVKPFRSRHIEDDHYFQQVLQYIHCNPAELYEPRWKEGVVKSMPTLIQKLTEYPYSSLCHYAHKSTHTKVILDKSVFEISTVPEAKKMLEEAAEYYQEVMSR